MRVPCCSRSRLSVAMVAVLVALLLGLPAAVRAQSADHPADKPLRVAADVGLPPFAMKEASGKVEGLSVDVAAEIAKRLGRPGYEIVDVNFSAIFAGLFAKRYEFILAPTLVTEERVKQMLFTEPYLDGGHGIVTLAAVPDLKTLEELRGKIVAVNNGSAHDKWATEQAKTYALTIQRYDKTADAVQAVITRRAFAAAAELNSSLYAATQQKQIKVAYRVYTGQQSGFPFRKDDVDFRNKVERIVEGMKLDGTFAGLHKKWFGGVPAADSAMNKVWVGYGPVNFEGYVVEPHRPQFQ